MAKLISDFFCVAVAGPTVDGREIRASWLTDMAEQYNTALYEAFIWYEHYRWGGNFGSIYAVKAEKGEDGLLRLYNRLVPSPELLQLNQAQQKLHTSIEVLTSWRGKNKAYQYGLGITDSPASIGTDRLAFSAGFQKLSDEERHCVDGICQHVTQQKVNEFKRRVPGVDQTALEIFISQPLPDLEFSKERSFFDFGSLFRKQESKPLEENMNENEVNALIEKQLSGFKQSLLDELKQTFGSQALKPAETPVPAIDPLAPPVANTGSAEMAVFKQQLDQLTQGQQKIMEALDKIPVQSIFRAEATGENNKQKPKW